MLCFHSKSFENKRLEKTYEKCTSESKKFKGILSFGYDNGFEKYENKEHSHEAAYDAYMTGFVFAKICKHKQIDELQNKIKEGVNKRKSRVSETQSEDTDASMKEEAVILNASKPSSLKNTPINYLDTDFCKQYVNYVILNPNFADLTCYHLNPEMPDQNMIEFEKRYVDLVWVKFDEAYKTNKL